MDRQTDKTDRQTDKTDMSKKVIINSLIFITFPQQLYLWKKWNGKKSTIAAAWQTAAFVTSQRSVVSTKKLFETGREKREKNVLIKKEGL